MTPPQQVALVVGASRGIGRQIAIDLAKNNYKGRLSNQHVHLSLHIKRYLTAPSCRRRQNRLGSLSFFHLYSTRPQLPLFNYHNRNPRNHIPRLLRHGNPRGYQKLFQHTIPG